MARIAEVAKGPECQRSENGQYGQKGQIAH